MSLPWIQIRLIECVFKLHPGFMCFYLYVCVGNKKKLLQKITFSYIKKSLI